MNVRIVAFDWDGTLLNSFRGHPVMRKVKSFFFMSFRRFYILAELAEVCAGVSWRMNLDAHRTVDVMRAKGIAVGIITDRSLFSFVISALRAGFNLRNLDFIYARESKFNKFVMRKIPAGVLVITTSYFKGDLKALADLARLSGALEVKPTEVLFVGDDKRDRITAEQCGFKFVQVDRGRPNFKLVRDAISE